MNDSLSHRSRAATALALVAFAFLFVPLAVVVLFSFNATSSVTLPFHGFSTRWYEAAFSDPEITSALLNSLIVATVVAGTTLVLGSAAAYAISRSGGRFAGAAGGLLFAPIAMPGIFLGVALLTCFGRVHLQLSLLTVALGHFVFTFPFFYLVARIALDRSDRTLEEVAADLGASPWVTARRVVLPQVAPVLAGAAGVAFMLSFDEFFITNFLIAADQTVPILVFARLLRTIDPTVNVISTLLLAVTVLVGALMLLAGLRARRRSTSLENLS